MLEWANKELYQGQFMPFDQTLRDDKNNLIAVALFETHLSKFILEHPAFYQTIYAKVFQAIHNFFYKDPHQNAALQAFLRNKPAHYDLERHLYTIFSRLNEQFPEQTSMRTLNDCFDLPSADYFIKLILDDFLVPSNPSPVMMELVIKAHSSSIDEEESPTPFRAGFFLAHDNLNRRSPYNSTRPPPII